MAVLIILACRGIVRRFLVRLCKSNNIFLNCHIIRTKNDHERLAMPLRLRRTAPGDLGDPIKRMYLQNYNFYCDFTRLSGNYLYICAQKYN